MNPVLAGILLILGVTSRDASILADPGSRTYYLYTSTDSGIAAYQSKDLAKWEAIPEFQVSAPEGAELREPRVFAYRGKCYLFVTMSDRNKVIGKPPESWRVNTAQGIRALVSESARGPFTYVSAADGGTKAYTPAESVTSGGSLYVEGDLAWLVYAHDWTQLVDADIEAVRLKADLSTPVEEPVYLFKASDAPWLALQKTTARDPRYYPAGGPLVLRTRNGSLNLIWWSAKNGKPAVVVARSITGKLRGPWTQRAVLLEDGSKPGSIFRTLDGRLMLVLHQAEPGQTKLLELDDAGDVVRAKRTKK